MWPEETRSHERRAEHDMTRALLNTVFEFTCSKAVIRQCALQSRDAPGRQMTVAKPKEETTHPLRGPCCTEGQLAQANSRIAEAKVSSKHCRACGFDMRLNNHMESK